MKKLALIFASTAVLVACETEPQATVVDSLIGKDLVAADGTTFVFNADGTAGGSFRGEAVAGTYSANASEVCSTYTAPQTLVDVGEICSVPAIDGDTVIFNRRNGSQSQAYTIQG